MRIVSPLRTQRKSAAVGLRALARAMKIAPSYLHDLEQSPPRRGMSDELKARHARCLTRLAKKAEA